MKRLFAFLSQIRGAQKGILVPEELYRSIVTALGSGGSIGLILTILQSILAHAQQVFPNPLVGGLASAALTLIVDLLRRQGQGEEPNPAAKSA